MDPYTPREFPPLESADRRTTAPFSQGESGQFPHICKNPP